MKKQTKIGITVSAILATLTVVLLRKPPKLGVLSVYVTDADTGSPIEDILLGLDGLEAATDASGYYGYTELEPGTYWMSATDPHHRYEPKPSVVPEGIPIPATKRLDIELVPLPPGPPPTPEPFQASFTALCCGHYKFYGKEEGLAESLYGVPELKPFITKLKNEILPEIVNSYIAQYKPTGLCAGPRHFYKWDDEGGETVHGYELFGREFEGRVKYPPTPQSGIKMVVPALEGKNWTCYLDINVPYAFSSDYFLNCLRVDGSGSLVKFRGPTWNQYRALPTAGHVAMLRIESGDERLALPCVLIRRFHGTGYDVGGAVNWEYQLANLLTEHKLALWKYGLSRSKLIDLYNKYEGQQNVYAHGAVYKPDSEDAEEAGTILLDRPGDIYAEPVNGDWLYHVNYTLDEVEAAYTTKVSAEDREYAETKALFEGLKAKYAQNWTDP